MPEAAVPAKPAPRPSTLVVTGENRQEFMDHRMDLAKPAAAAPAPEPAKAEPAKADAAKAEPAAPAAAPEGEVAKLEADLKAEEAKPKGQQDEKKKQTFRERISEITEQKKTAQAETAKERERAERLERELAEERAKAAAPPPPADAPKAPLRAEFASDEEYQDARVDYRVKVARAEERKADAEANAKREGERVMGTYAERLKATKSEIPDFDARIEKSKDLVVAPHIRDAIFDSEVGPRMALYFADHPEEAARINRLSPSSGLREFGKIETMLETGGKVAATPEPKAEPKPAPRAEVSKAPEPINPLKGVGAAEPEPKIDSKGQFTGTFAEWKAFRKAGKIK